MMLSRRLSMFAGVLTLALAAPALAAAPQVHIVGNHFADQSGHVLRLIGVNAGPDLTDACVGPTFGDPYRIRSGGVWAGPVDDRSIAVMNSWHVGVARISLNEDCWLGINPVKRSDSSIGLIRHGAASAGQKLAHHYRSEVEAFVRRLHAHGLIVIIDLHWTAPGRTLAFDQFPMADADHSIALWKSVASTFKNDHSVVFDVFNEPFLSNSNKLTWSCLRNGCRLPNECADCSASDPPHGCGSACPVRSHPDGTYKSAGIQALVSAIRSTGARQPIITPGLSYTNDLTQWWKYRPHDPLNQLGVSMHAYQGQACSDVTCWDRVVVPLLRRVPVVIGEFGPNTYDANGNQLTEPCDASYDTTLMNWADANGASYLAWSWYFDNSPYDNDQLPNCTLNLLRNSWYDGTPRSGHGQAVHDHLAALSAAQGGGAVFR